MNDDVAISVENVSKKFCKSLKRSMFYGIQDIGRNALGMSSRSHSLRKNEFWAVDDVSFQVRKGETLGIIGANGSGKTTMLKLINGIFWPDKGKIAVRGRVGALISVGAGFHPILTGRENIYLNGAILGMTKEEIDDRYDEIIEFADIGDFIDAPVKYYSSGMFVRLGFSIAVNVEPEVLLIDEILAVGDLAFRNKSLRKLSKLREKAHSIVLVSHNLVHIRNLCSQTLVINEGKPMYIGETDEALSIYHDMARRKKLEVIEYQESGRPRLRQTSGDIEFKGSGIIDNSGSLTTTVNTGEAFTAFFDFVTQQDIEELYFSVGIRDEKGILCIFDLSNYKGKYTFDDISKGRYRLNVTFSGANLVPGVYFPVLTIRNGVTNETYERIFNLDSFRLEGDMLSTGILFCQSKWDLCSVDNNDQE